MISIIGIALISAVLYGLIKKYSPEYAVFIEIGAIIIILLTVYPYICDVIDFFASYSSENDYASLLLKITGIAVLTQFASDICGDCGESALAAKIEFAGKSIILALSVPTVKTLLEFAIGLIKE